MLTMENNKTDTIASLPSSQLTTPSINTTNESSGILPSTESPPSDTSTTDTITSPIPDQAQFVEVVSATEIAPSNPSFYRRELQKSCIPFNSSRGRELFREAIIDGTMECYYPLSEQFVTQSEPAYCAISTLAMCLNALAVEPSHQWRKPWRWFSEEILECCRPLSVIQKEGMTFTQFSALARCNGVIAKEYRAENSTIEHFRKTIIDVATTSSVVEEGFTSSNSVSKERGGLKSCLAVSYSRKILQQTGDGHMSPIGGYHRKSDSVLILDVARFKYPPHWVTVETMWNALLPHDKVTGRSRGYCVFSTICSHEKDNNDCAIEGVNNTLNTNLSCNTNGPPLKTILCDGKVADNSCTQPAIDATMSRCKSCHAKKPQKSLQNNDSSIDSNNNDNNGSCSNNCNDDNNDNVKDNEENNDRKNLDISQLTLQHTTSEQTRTKAVDEEKATTSAIETGDSLTSPKCKQNRIQCSHRCNINPDDEKLEQGYNH